MSVRQFMAERKPEEMLLGDFFFEWFWTIWAVHSPLNVCFWFSILRTKRGLPNCVFCGMSFYMAIVCVKGGCGERWVSLNQNYLESKWGFTRKILRNDDHLTYTCLLSLLISLKFTFINLSLVSMYRMYTVYIHYYICIGLSDLKEYKECHQWKKYESNLWPPWLSVQFRADFVRRLKKSSKVLIRRSTKHLFGAVFPLFFETKRLLTVPFL
jgi:hypothetical protein